MWRQRSRPRSTMSACSPSKCSCWSTDSGPKILVNEIAPRVHNSGHWTLDGASISQFEQHIRAIAGWPLGKPVRHGPVTMTNLIGDEILDYEQWLTVPGATVHLYGKGAAAAGPQDGPCDAGRDGQSENGLTGCEKRPACSRQSAQIGASRRWTIPLLSDTSARSRSRATAFRQPFAFTRFHSDPLKEDAACRFSFAITTSIKPSRR